MEATVQRRPLEIRISRKPRSWPCVYCGHPQGGRHACESRLRPRGGRSSSLLLDLFAGLFTRVAVFALLVAPLGLIVVALVLPLLQMQRHL